MLRSLPIPASLLALALGASGCTHVYQPLSGLHRPIVIDPDVANFQDLRLTVYCPPGDLLGPAEAASLCRMVGLLFENQGAQVTTSTRDRRLVDEEAQALGEGEAAAPRADLVLELRARQLSHRNDPLRWILCYGTLSLVPAVTETTFAQDVTIRDGSGFLLLSDTLKGRIVRRFGVGTWAGNKLLDLVWRDPEDEIVGSDKAGRDLSADLYGQLSQLMFNAEMRWKVLQQVPPVSGEGAP